MTGTPPPLALPELEARLRQDLATLLIPAPNWVPPRAGVIDVLIVGAGMLGLAASFCLMRLGILNHRVIDAAREGREGPWVTHARMETLRSPKRLTGPAQDMPNLTFRAWYTAQWGEEAFRDLGKIPRGMWMDHLRWFRRVLALPVTNGVAMTGIGPGPDRLVAVATDREGVLLARHVVLATGRDGMGGARIPDWVPAPRGPLIRHSSEAIDFAALAGRSVAVVGASASAIDNAATALEQGAMEAHLLVRRPALPRFNRFKALIHAGYTHGLPALDDAARRAFLDAAFEGAVAPPRESLLRLARLPGFRLHLATPVLAAAEDAEGVTLSLPQGRLRVAQLILGTGFGVSLEQRPDLAGLVDQVRLRGAEAGAFAGHPLLGPGFEFTGADWAGRVHAFNIAAMASLGMISGDIPGVSDGARRLGQGIAAALFSADAAAHLAALRAYDDPELLGDEIPTLA